jgi:DNA-binding XRE family transcriptional regulator
MQNQFTRCKDIMQAKKTKKADFNNRKNRYNSKNRELFAIAIKANGYTLDELSVIIKTHQTTIHHLLTGRRRPSLHTASKIEEVFGLSISDWLD